MPPDAIVKAVIGGALIGAAATGLLLFNGRIAGIFSGLLPPWGKDTPWRLAFVAGLLSGGALVLSIDPGAFGPTIPRSVGRLAAAGLLVGVGTRIGNGCTSGHGVCGLARRSRRSLAATLTFMTTGALTVYVVRHVVGASLP
ncbi:MAG TPA: YeeE/YedE family protein [Candidatus Eisenbacteria bacterium]|nr:YeeE/YedE family protein [Candidatus Eisenbacteria bacterium]